jgi:hypothetical protein
MTERPVLILKSAYIHPVLIKITYARPASACFIQLANTKTHRHNVTLKWAV